MPNTEPAGREMHIVSYEDYEGKRSVLDIKALDTPPVIEGSRSFTALSKEGQRRLLMTTIAREVDLLVRGEVSEISIRLHS